ALPVLLDQAARQSEPVTQSSEAVSTHQAFDVPGDNLEVLGVFGERLGGERKNRLPFGQQTRRPTFGVRTPFGRAGGAAGILEPVINRRRRYISPQIHACRRGFGEWFEQRVDIDGCRGCHQTCLSPWR